MGAARNLKLGGKGESKGQDTGGNNFCVCGPKLMSMARLTHRPNRVFTRSSKRSANIQLA